MLKTSELLNELPKGITVENKRIQFSPNARQNLLKIGAGLHTKVYKIQDKRIVIKEGRKHKHLDIIYNRINQVSQSMDGFEELDNIYANVININHKLYEKIFNSPNTQKEYSMYNSCNPGKMAAVEEKLKKPLVPPQICVIGNKNFGSSREKTYYIIQEYVDGTNLDKQKLPQNQRDIMALIGLKALIGADKNKVIPDFRPALHKPFEWFTTTENITVTRQGKLVILDTGWVWYLQAGVLTRGVVIPQLIKNSIKRYLEEYGK